MYYLYLYFLGLSLRNNKALVIFRDKKRSYFSIWNSIQRFGSSQIYKRKRISAFIIDETVIQIGNQHFWLRIAIESVKKTVLGIYIFNKRPMFLAENFLKSLVDKYNIHTVYTDGGTWYLQACTFLHLKHKLYSPLEKNLIERVVQCFKDRTENVDDYYPCIQDKMECNLLHVLTGYNFLYIYNDITYYKVYSITHLIKGGGYTLN
jgi:putative transposase